MCISPAALTIVSTIAGLAGTAVSGIAQIQAQRAQEQQARNNAIIAQRNANDARARGNVAVQDVQLKTRAMIGKQINILSERSISLASGSALDIIGDTAMFGKLDAITTKQNYEREAISHEAQRMNFNATAEQARMGATAATFGLGAGLLTTALGGVQNYYKATGKMTL